MCISRFHTEMSLPSSSVRTHLPGYPRRLAKMWGCILASSYCSRKASTSKHQSVYIISAPGLVDLKIGISNLVGASRFLSLLPLWPLRLCRWPAVSLTVEYPSESGAPLSGEEGGKPPLPTVVHWVFGGLPCDCMPSMASESCLSLFPHPRCSPILLRCTPHQLARGVRLPCHSNWCIMGRVLGPTSEPSAVRGSDRPLPHLHQGEAANIEVGRVRDPLQKGLLHMDLDSIRGILHQTPTALLVIEEQVSSTRAIYLHMFQLPKNWIALEYVHDHPCIPRECGRVGLTRAVSHCHFQHQGVFFCRGVPHPFPDICQCVRQPLQGKSWGLIQ